MPNAAIHPDFAAMPDGLYHLGQAVQTAPGAIKLAPAVVGDHQHVSACLHSQHGVVAARNPFDDQFALPAVAHLAQARQVKPGVIAAADRGSNGRVGGQG